MYLLVWDEENYRGATLGQYNKYLASSLKDATMPTKSATRLGELVARHFEKRKIIVSRIPLEQRVFEDREEKEYYSDAWYEIKDLQGKKCRLSVHSRFSRFLGNGNAVDISVGLHFYLYPDKRDFSPEEAYEKYPLLAVENMAIFPGLDVVALVQKRSDLDTVLPLLDRYVNLIMRYEELVAEQAQRFHGGIERFINDDSWPYDILDVLVFGYVPFSSVEKIYIEGTWALFDNLCLRGAPPIEVGIVPVLGAVPFYPTRQPETLPAFTELFYVFTDVTGGRARIMAEKARLLLSQNLSELGFDEDGVEMAERLAQVIQEKWEHRALED